MARVPKPSTRFLWLLTLWNPLVSEAFEYEISSPGAMMSLRWIMKSNYHRTSFMNVWKKQLLQNYGELSLTRPPREIVNGITGPARDL